MTSNYNELLSWSYRRGIKEYVPEDFDDIYKWSNQHQYVKNTNNKFYNYFIGIIIIVIIITLMIIWLTTPSEKLIIDMNKEHNIKKRIKVNIINDNNINYDAEGNIIEYV